MGVIPIQGNHTVYHGGNYVSQSPTTSSVGA